MSARCIAIKRSIPSTAMMGIEKAAIGWTQSSPEELLMKKEAEQEYRPTLARLAEAINYLQVSFPAIWSQHIKKLFEYMVFTGKRYQIYAATIRRWAGKDAKSGPALSQPGLQRKGG